MIIPSRILCNIHQELLYHHWKENSFSDIHHISYVLQINGKLQREAFTYACNVIFKSHYAFGLKFKACANHKVTFTYNSSTLPVIKFHALRSSYEFNLYMAKFLIRPFNLDTGDTFYIDLVNIAGSDTNYLLINCHKIVCDKSSFCEFIKQLSALYNNSVSNKHLDIKASASKYLELNKYANTLTGNLIITGKQEQSHKNLLKNYNLPGKTTVDVLMISKAVKYKIHRYCIQKGISPFIFYLGCYHILFRLIRENEEITTIITLSHRPFKRHKDVIGFFEHQFKLHSTINTMSTIDDVFRYIQIISMPDSIKSNDVIHCEHSEVSAITSRLKPIVNHFSYQNHTFFLNLDNCKISLIPITHKKIQTFFSINVQEHSDSCCIEFAMDNCIAREIDVRKNMHAIIQEIIKQRPIAIKDWRILSNLRYKPLIKC